MANNRMCFFSDKVLIHSQNVLFKSQRLFACYELFCSKNCTKASNILRLFYYNGWIFSVQLICDIYCK